MTATVLRLLPQSTTMRLSPAELDQVDVRGAEVADDELERIEIGVGEIDLILEGPDLVREAGRIQELMTRVIESVIDARQDHLYGDMVECWCGTRVTREQVTCGGAECNRYERQDAQGLVP